MSLEIIGAKESKLTKAQKRKLMMTLATGKGGVHKLRSAAKLVRAARKGNTAAAIRLRNIQTSAESGNPEALEAYEVVQAVAPLPGAQKAAESDNDNVPDEDAEYEDEDVDGSVSGWLYNKGYRNNIQAMELDKKNPFHVMRGIYTRGADIKSSGLVDLGKKLLGMLK